RPSRAASLVEEGCAVRTELVAVDTVLDLPRRVLRGEIRRPQLDAEVALFGMLDDVEDAVAGDGEALHPVRDLAGPAGERRDGQRSSPRPQIVAGEIEEVATRREAVLADVLADDAGNAFPRAPQQRPERRSRILVGAEQGEVALRRDGERGRAPDLLGRGVERGNRPERPVAALPGRGAKDVERAVGSEGEIRACPRRLAGTAGGDVEQLDAASRGSRRSRGEPSPGRGPREALHAIQGEGGRRSFARQIHHTQAAPGDEGELFSGGGPGEGRDAVGEGANASGTVGSAKLPLAVAVPVAGEEGQGAAGRIVGASAAQVGDRQTDPGRVARGDLGQVE